MILVGKLWRNKQSDVTRNMHKCAETCCGRAAFRMSAKSRCMTACTSLAYKNDARFPKNFSEGV